MLLKHLVKISSIFNALKGYPVLSIVYENYAQKTIPYSLYASKKFSVKDASMAENLKYKCNRILFCVENFQHGQFFF